MQTTRFSYATDCQIFFGRTSVVHPNMSQRDSHEKASYHLLLAPQDSSIHAVSFSYNKAFLGHSSGNLVSDSKKAVAILGIHMKDHALANALVGELRGVQVSSVISYRGTTHTLPPTNPYEKSNLVLVGVKPKNKSDPYRSTLVASHAAFTHFCTTKTYNNYRELFGGFFETLYSAAFSNEPIRKGKIIAGVEGHDRFICVNG